MGSCYLAGNDGWFDNDGVNICLKDYPDPSFLKMACSRSELMKPKSCKEKTMLTKPRCTGKWDESRGMEKFILCQYYGSIEGIFILDCSTLKVKATQYRTQAILGPCGQL